MTQGSGQGKRLDVVSVLISVLALVASGVSSYYSWRNDSRIDRQEELQIASKVYLDEAPQYAYKIHSAPKGKIWRVVRNTSYSSIENVWVEGTGGRTVILHQVQGCTMYALPIGFVTVAVYFEENDHRWRRGWGPVRPTKSAVPTPKKDTDDAAWPLDVQGCS